MMNADADVWEPSAALSPEYDSTTVAAYASSRMPACYAVLYRVFDDIERTITCNEAISSNQKR